jgi:hypothetical protein
MKDETTKSSIQALTEAAYQLEEASKALNDARIDAQEARSLETRRLNEFNKAYEIFEKACSAFNHELPRDTDAHPTPSYQAD